MFILCIHISTHIQQGQQAGVSLRLFTGKIQRTALVDLSSGIYIIYIQAEEIPGEDINTRVTVASPCLSFQCLLRGRPAASPCLACSSKLLYVEDCSTTLGLQSRNKYSYYTNFIMKILNFFPNEPYLGRPPRYVNGFLSISDDLF